MSSLLSYAIASSATQRMRQSAVYSASVLALLLAGTHGQSAYASDISEGDTIEAVESDAYDLIEEVTVTATRAERSAFTFPGSVSVITKDEIDDLVASSIADLFINVPTVQFTGGPRRTGEVPSIRGTGGAGVLVLFDGVRQNFLSAHDGRFFIDPSLLRSAEVVRGPASSIYGSGALGGVMAFQTIKARDLTGDDSTLAVQLRTGYQGVNGEFNTGLTAALRSEDDRFDGVASLTWRDSGNIDLGDGNSLAADDEIGSGLLKGTWRASDDLTLSAQWIAYRGGAVEPNNAQFLASGDLVDKDINADTFRVGVVYNPADQNLINTSLTAYYSNAEVAEDIIDSPREISREMESYGFVIDNRSLFEFGKNASMVVSTGIEYYRDEQVGLDNQTVSGQRGGVPNGTSDNFGAFVQAEIDIQSEIGRFQIIPALRYDDFELESVDQGINQSNTAWNPRVGVSYEPTNWLLIFGSWGESFRAPAFNEIFANGIHFQIPLAIPGQAPVFAPNSFIPNPDLQPEEAETWEFGAGLNFADVVTADDKLFAKVTYFDTTASNLIDLEVNVGFAPSCFSAFIPGPCTSGTSRNANVANAILDGVEIEAGYDSPYFFLNGAFSTISGEDTDTGDYLGILIPDRFNITAGFKLPDYGLRFGARSEIASRFTSVNDPELRRPSYETVDIFASWSPNDGALKGLRVDAGVDNVTDAIIERVAAGVPDPGRNWKAAVNYTYRF